MRVHMAILLALGISWQAPSQPYGTHLIVTGAISVSTVNALLYRLDGRGGGFTTIVTGNFSPITAMAMDSNNTDILASHLDGRVVSIDPVTGVVVRVLWAGPPLDWVKDFCFSDTEDVVVVGKTPTYNYGVFRISADGMRFDTLCQGLMYPVFVTRDLMTGDYLVGDQGLGPTLYRLSPDGSRKTTLYRGLISSLDLVQDHKDGSVLLYFNFAAVKRITTGGATLLIRNGIPGGRALALDRAPGHGEIVAFGNSILRLTGNGKIVTTLAQPPPLWAAMRACFEKSRNLVTDRTGSPNAWRFRLHFPGEGGRGYVMGLSATGFTPGIRVGSRIVPLVRDDLLMLTVTGALCTVLRGNTGFLNAGGRAVATLDLRPLGGSVKGIRLWCAALTLDARARFNIATISKPSIIVLE